MFTTIQNCITVSFRVQLVNVVFVFIDNPFNTTDVYSLKTSESLFSVFRGYRRRPVSWIGLTRNICNTLTLSWRRSYSYRNQFIDLPCKSMDWFLYDRDLHHERVKLVFLLSNVNMYHCIEKWSFPLHGM